MRAIFALAAMLAGIAAAQAEEQPVEIKSAPGSEIVEGNCGACHSLDYIRINSSFMTPQGWQAEVNKMINSYGAPIEPADAGTIVDYLIKNYGKPS